MGGFIIGISFLLLTLFTLAFWRIPRTAERNPTIPPPPPDRPTTTPPPPTPRNETFRNSLTGLDDGCMILLIILFFCIFPPISILLVILWIIDEIRGSRR